MTITLPPLFAGLTFLSPLADSSAEVLVGFLSDGLHGIVLDVGCGWAELLLRVVAAAPASRGMGIDLDEASIEHGVARAAERGVADRVTLVCGDAGSEAARYADAVVCIGASQVWGPPVEDNKPLDYAAALSAVRALVTPGARVVYGEGIWSRPPTDAAIAPLAGRRDELVPLAELVELAVNAGFMPMAVREADIGEWDAFESGFGARYTTWIAEHDSDHPDAAEVRARAARQRAAYFAGYRGIMGMAYLSLIAT